MKLIDLEPEWMLFTGEGQRSVDTMAEANGIWFLCPKCQRHGVLCWTPEVPAGIAPGPGRWKMSGTGFDDLTLHPSVNLDTDGTGCRWHGWVKNGEAA